MKKILAIIGLSAMAGCLAIAGNLPNITVSAANRIGGKQLAAASTNAPSVVTTNLPGFDRAWLIIQNTNAAGNVTVFAGASTNAPQAVLAPGQAYALSWPTIDNNTYSCRTDGAALSVIVSEGWGQ